MVKRNLHISKHGFLQWVKTHGHTKDLKDTFNEWLRTRGRAGRYRKRVTYIERFI